MKRNPIAFHSKSANMSRKVDSIEKTKDKVQKSSLITAPKHALIIGNASAEFLEYGVQLGYHPILYEAHDPSVLLYTSVFVMYEMGATFPQHIATLEFARMYTVPTVWIHRRIDPGRFAFSFDMCFVGEIPVSEIWREICQMIA